MGQYLTHPSENPTIVGLEFLENSDQTVDDVLRDASQYHHLQEIIRDLLERGASLKEFRETLTSVLTEENSRDKVILNLYRTMNRLRKEIHELRKTQEVLFAARGEKTQ